MRLKNKVALVTGAAQGIGEAIARAFVAEGAIVIATDIKVAGIERVAAEAGCEAIPLDVREEDQWRAVLAQVVERHGPLNVLVNNAGITGLEDGAAPHDPEHCALEDWRAVHQTNLDGVFLGCKHGITAMRGATSGSIINMSSRSGIVGIPGAAAYASTKAAVRNHTKSVALYCAAQGLPIRCNSLHPAAILTPMWDPMLGVGDAREANMINVAQGSPLKRFGRPDEVASVAVMLASDESSYMTGSEVHIDGGILAGAGSPPARR